MSSWTEPKWAIFRNLKTVSESNVVSSQHWGARKTRAKKQREPVCEQLAKLWTERPPITEGYLLVITITRMSPRLLDSGDNVSGSQKHVKDGIADWLKTNDRNPLILWRFEQQKHPQYAVKIHIEPECSPCDCCTGKGYLRAQKAAS